MTLAELRYKVITAALTKYNGNAELAALQVGVTARTIYSFKAKQLIEKKDEDIRGGNNAIISKQA